MSNVNEQLADVFAQMADMSQILGENRFKTIAYQKAARVLEEWPQDVAGLGKSELTAIDGIGAGTADRILEFVTTGQIKAFVAMQEKIPEGVMAMLGISGLGPKTVQLFWQQAGVTTVAELKQKLESGELTKLKGFGQKKAEQLLKSIAFAEQSGGRARLGKAMPLAEAIVEAMLKVDGVEQAEFAGSLRRGKETIGDIDVLVATGDSETYASLIADAFKQLPFVTEVIADGQTKTSVRTEQGIQCDLRVVKPDVFGAALMYFTGSKEHNVAMRGRAQSMGMTLNEYGLYEVDASGEKGDVVAAETEQAVFEALKLAWVAPELREDHGELKLAEEDQLPKLIDVSDVVAELHTHTTASDGSWSIRELAQAAVERGCHTLAVTDHSKGQAQANGLNEERLLEHIQAIKQVAKEFKGKLNLLCGSEVDILSDGQMDYADEILAQLDVVVASPHAALTQDSVKATDRLIKAIENPYVHIIGHPTGRLINRREGLKPDMSAVIEAAKAHGKALEINANHYRLDLRDKHARQAIEAGVVLSINTDAHGPADFGQLRFGVLTAKRAGATAEDVINCWDAKRLKKWLAR